jgi:uncharacterized protein (DUF1015 family)
VVAPPYDVISPASQRHFHDKDAYNAVHVDFALEEPGDDDSNNRYTRAAATLSDWVEHNILVPESRPAFYLCREEYQSPDGTPTVREGFIAAVRLSEFTEGKILPHEETASGPKQDRLQLMQATEANLSAIYCLYSEPDNASVLLAAGIAGDPDIDLTDEAGTRHSVWAIDDPEITAALSASLSEKTLLIADGHHRYETMLAYRNARREQENPEGDQPYDFAMVYLSNMDVDGKSILPIHRFVSGLKAETLSALPGALEEDFEIHPVPGGGTGQQQKMIDMMKELDGVRNAFGMYLAADSSYQVLVGRQPRPMLSDGNGRSAAYRSLDVAVLDRAILSGALGISPDGANPNARVTFMERTSAALEALAGSGCQVAFFVNPTSMEEIKLVAEAGEKMPQKSTYFYPKPLTGLIFRSFQY